MFGWISNVKIWKPELLLSLERAKMHKKLPFCYGFSKQVVVLWKKSKFECKKKGLNKKAIFEYSKETKLEFHLRGRFPPFFLFDALKSKRYVF